VTGRLLGAQLGYLGAQTFELKCLVVAGA